MKIISAGFLVLSILLFSGFSTYSSAENIEIIKTKTTPKFETKPDPVIHLSDRDGNIIASPINKWLILDNDEKRYAIRIGRAWPSSSSILKDVELDENREYLFVIEKITNNKSVNYRLKEIYDGDNLIYKSDNSIRSLLGVPFGNICTIKANFIDKPNTYYAQNVAKAEYYLKIVEINNNKLLTPLVIEPIYQNIKIDKNKMYTLKAYEIVTTMGEPRGWTDDIQQLNYSINHKIVIKSP